MTPTEFVEGAQWIGREFLKIFYTPVGVAGGMIDAFRGWKFSRSWVRFWFHLPTLVLLVTVYLVFGFTILGRNDSRIQSLSVKSEKNCATKLMEEIYAEQSEAEFSKVAGLSNIEVVPYKTVPLSDVTKRYVELLSKRILSIQPKNQIAHYRLGLIYSLTEQNEAARSEMLELANGKYGESVQANAWMAKDLLKQRVAGIEVSAPELASYLEKGSKWKNVDFRLVTYYARILEAMGDAPKAILLTKQAAVNRPELNLDLARLYYRQGYQAEARSVASSVEDLFIKKLNTPLEKESDRLAVAEARRITNRLEQAAEVLEEGLTLKSSGSATRRELSEVYRLFYVKTVFKTEAGPYQADLAQLEKVVDMDPSNPNISGEIAKLLPLKIKPNKKLVEVLKKQIEAGVTSVSAHILLAEGYLQFGNTKEAIKNWELALAKDPNQPGALNNLALVLAKESESNIERSLSLLNKAITLSPNNPEILDSLGDVLMMGKRPKDAINKFELSIRFDPQRLGTRKKLFEAYQLNGMDDMAKVLGKVIEKMERAKAEEEAKEKEAAELN
jgi:tetratricopeptide (TPR) repeat protein